MGGDEFTVIIRNVEEKEDLYNVVNKIQEELRKVMTIGEINCNVDSSIGISVYPHNGADKETLLKTADSLMYDIKKSGKGSFKFGDNY